MAEPLKIPFGLADITFGEGPTAIKFNGIDFMQADGGELKISPILKEIKIADIGDSTYDNYVIGHTCELKIVGAEEDIKLLEMAFSYMDSITEAGTGATVGLMDSKIGTSMRSKAKKVTIHPRNKTTSDKSSDVVIYKAAGSGDFTRTYANDQGKAEITLTAYPRDGYDVSKPGNYYYIGATDPNAA